MPKDPSRASSSIATGVEILGMVSITVGVGLWSIPLALVIAGLLAVILAQGIG